MSFVQNELCDMQHLDQWMAALAGCISEARATGIEIEQCWASLLSCIGLCGITPCLARPHHDLQRSLLVHFPRYHAAQIWRRRRAPTPCETSEWQTQLGVPRHVETRSWTLWPRSWQTLLCDGPSRSHRCKCAASFIAKIYTMLVCGISFCRVLGDSVSECIKSCPHA